MEKIKKVVVEKQEVASVQITEKEFAEIAAKECANMFTQLSNSGEKCVEDILLPIICAKYAAHIMARIFADDNEESEDKCNG